MPGKPINMRLPDDVIAMLDTIAARTNESRTALVERLVRQEATSQRTPRPPSVAPQRPATASAMPRRPAATRASTAPHCPKCGARTIPQGHGNQSCSLCEWKGKV